MKQSERRARLSAARRPRPLLSLLTLLAAVSPTPAQQSPTLTPAAGGEAVKLDVTVTDGGGRHLTGLGATAFTVTEGKARREITLFEAGDRPTSVFVLFDGSGSVDKKNLNAARFALVRFIQLSNPANEYFVAEFSSEYRALTGWTRDAKVIADGLNRIGGADPPRRLPQPRGTTAMYDACDAALVALSGASSQKRVLLLLTDGGPDTSSRNMTRKRLARRLRETGVLFYAVAAQRRPESPSAKSLQNFVNQLGLPELKELAVSSGGNVFVVDTLDGLYEAVGRVAVELRSQYLIGFAADGAARPGKWNRVRIEVAKPEGFKGSVRVRSREGYFSAAVDP